MKIRLLVVLLVLASLLGCTRSQKAMQIKGSDTMVNLAQAWAEQYMNIHPETAIAITGGGSGTGIAAIIANATDIAQCSRNIKAKEIKMAEKHGVEPVEWHVANDGIVVAVNPANPVNKLTIGQLSGIFTGKIKNWQEVGGQNKRIVALSRERNSGTHVFFLEEVVKLGEKKNPNEFAPSILMMPSSQAIIEEVDANPAAIGYIGLGYLTKKEKALAVAKSNDGPYVVPSVKSVVQKKYPISRSLLFYTNGVPSGEVKAFIDYVFSRAGQEIVLKMDFVPIHQP
ncbi:MAG: phosphate ABC transporter substrate-binding protein [bacterium]